MKSENQFFRRPHALILLLAAGAFVLLSACSPAAAQQPNPITLMSPVVPSIKTSQPQAIQIPSSPVPTIQPSPASPSPTPPAPAAVPCLGDLCIVPGSLFLLSPISPPDNDVVDQTYRFGSTQSGMRDPHHGVEFLNRFGTPVQAAGDGVVVVAGTDLDPTSAHGVWPITFYGPYSNFYGNLVVIEHPLPASVEQAFPEMTGPIYSLYGHLSEIAVQVGQSVQAGQRIGSVGMAGIATGSHLHFEVRLGENSYKTSRNPELWLAPKLDSGGLPIGALAGRFLDPYGGYLEMPSITIQRLPGGPDGPSDFQVALITYEEKGLVGQPPFLESFGLGSLPAGQYRLSFPMGGLREELVQIYPGQLTVVTFRAE